MRNIINKLALINCIFLIFIILKIINSIKDLLLIKYNQISLILINPLMNLNLIYIALNKT